MSTELAVQRNGSSENQLQIAQESAERSVQSVAESKTKLNGLFKELMKDGEHHMVIPGTNKPTLLKAGAEMVNFTFRLAPRYQIEKTDLGEGHREYEVVCTLIHGPTGTEAAQGVGSCSTMESKYRYRSEGGYEVQDGSIPDDYRAKKAEYRKKGYGAKQIDGQWKWVKYGEKNRVENPDIADTWNTVLKMAKKRAFVDATLTATNASDFFTQDVEDFQDQQESVATSYVERDIDPYDDRVVDYSEKKSTPKSKQAPAKNGNDVEFSKKKSELITYITETTGVKGDPEGWSDEEKAMFKETFGQALKKGSVELLDLVERKVRFYAQYRGTDMAGSALDLARNATRIDELKLIDTNGGDDEDDSIF